MSIHTNGAGRRSRVMGAVTGAVLLATLGVGTDSALAAYTTSVQAGTLQIVGNGASDKLALRLAPGAPNTLQVDVGADGTPDFSFDRTTFTKIDVQAGGGEDSVLVDQSNGAFTDEQLTIDGGAGADVLLGGDGADILMGGDGKDFVDGNRGNDVAFLGSGDDTFVWDPGDGSDVVQGQAGNDAMAFNGSNVGEHIDISANGSRVRLFRDVGAVTMDLNGVEGVNLNVIGGADTVTVNDLTGTDLTTANVNLSAGGDDGQPDTVIADGTAGADAASIDSASGKVRVRGLSASVIVAGSEAGDNVNVATLGGADSITTAVGISTAASVNVDGGDGSDQLIYNGTASDDTIGVAPNGTAVRTTAQGSSPVDSTVENLVVHGLRGADTITGANGLAALTHLKIDGGRGDDALVGGDGADVLIGGDGNDLVDGNRGNDLALLGNGEDRFVWDPGDGSDVVEGQAGNDALDFNGSNVGEHVDISANGSRVRLFRDVGAVTMDFDDVENVNVSALGGADVLTVDDLTGTDLKNANVDLSATGGGDDAQPDTVIANGTARRDKVRVTRSGSRVLTKGLAAKTTIVGSSASDDTLRINTLGGNDRVRVAPDVNDLITPVIDLGVDE